MRGVEVNIVLPQKGNLRTVQWAMQATLWQVLEEGCRVWLTPPPFDHTKLMTVDGIWSLIGSGNWDARSLRLNFEFNVETYDARAGGTNRRADRNKASHGNGNYIGRRRCANAARPRARRNGAVAFAISLGESISWGTGRMQFAKGGGIYCDVGLIFFPIFQA